MDNVSGTTLGMGAAHGTRAPGPWAGTRPTPLGEGHPGSQSQAGDATPGVVELPR